MLENWSSTIVMVVAIHSHSESCFVILNPEIERTGQQIMLLKNVIRKFQQRAIVDRKSFFSFDGTSTHREAYTEFGHHKTALGNYRNSPFVTGGSDQGGGASGLKTEILDRESGTWVQADDYPFPLAEAIPQYV